MFLYGACAVCLLGGHVLKKWLVFVVALILLVGCQKKTENVLPEEMPADFNFKVQFGINKRNSINTYDNTVTKDLIVGGTASTALQLTEDDMRAIYEEMKEIHIGTPKKLIPQSTCKQIPYSEDEWHITVDGQTFDYSVSQQFCELTKDGKKLLALREQIWNIVREKPAYQELPEARGGYQ